MLLPVPVRVLQRRRQQQQAPQMVPWWYQGRSASTIRYVFAFIHACLRMVVMVALCSGNGFVRRMVWCDCLVVLLLLLQRLLLLHLHVYVATALPEAHTPLHLFMPIRQSPLVVSLNTVFCFPSWQVFVVELTRKPLFPGIYTPVMVKNERLLKEIAETKKQG